jgi:hypothetical protein
MSNQHLTVAVSPAALLAYAKTLEGQGLETIYRRSPFTVEAERDNLVFINSKGKRRSHGGKFLQRVCDHFAETNSLHPVAYRDMTVNASYTLALIKRYLEAQSQ